MSKRRKKCFKFELSELDQSNEEPTLKKRRIWNTREYVWSVPDFEKLKNSLKPYKVEGPEFQLNARGTGDGKCSLTVTEVIELDDTIIIRLTCLTPNVSLTDVDMSVRTSDGEIIEAEVRTRSGDDYYVKHLNRSLLIEKVIDNNVQIHVYFRYSNTELKSNQTIDPDSKLVDAWHYMSEDCKFSDVKLVVEDKVIHAHKVVLSSRSPVFRAMFAHDSMVENALGKVEIPDFSADTIRALRRYIYVNDVQIQDNDEAMSLAGAAEKYQIRDLKELCSNYLKRRINVRNAKNMLLFADKNNILDLKKCVMEYIYNNPKQFLDLCLSEELIGNPHLLSEFAVNVMSKLANK